MTLASDPAQQTLTSRFEIKETITNTLPSLLEKGKQNKQDATVLEWIRFLNSREIAFSYSIDQNYFKRMSFQLIFVLWSYFPCTASAYILLLSIEVV